MRCGFGIPRQLCFRQPCKGNISIPLILRLLSYFVLTRFPFRAVSYVLLLILSLCNELELYSQQFRFEHYVVNDGLPSSTVFDMAQDEKGALWIGTALGLCRYNGKDFVSYSVLDGLPGNSVYKVHPDDKGRLWLATYSGIGFWADGHYTAVPMGEKERLSSFNVSPDKKYYFTSKNKFYIYEDSVARPIDIQKGNAADKMGSYVLHLVDENENFWFGAGKSIARMKDGVMNLIYSEDQASKRQFIRQDNDGRIFLVSSRMVREIVDDKLENPYPGIDKLVSEGMDVSSIFIDPEGNWWIGTEASGIFLLSYRAREVLNSIQQFILKNDTISALDYLSEFGDLIRRSFENSKHLSIPLTDEIEFLKTYLMLEQMRFDDHIKYTIDVDPRIDIDNTSVPSLLIQPFVENSIRHGLKHKPNGGHIQIEFRLEDSSLICSIEDERKSREFLTDLLSQYCPEVEVVGAAASVTEAVELIGELNPELVFLDIEMPVHSGFKLLEFLEGEIDFDVIFITAFDQYAVKAFEYSAVDYILKPIKIKKLIQAIGKVRDRVERKSRRARLENLRDSVGREFRKIVLPTQEGYQFLEVRDIVRCEADSNYTTFYMVGGEMIFVSKTLKHVEELLENQEFFRIHQSHLINLRHIRKYIKGKAGQVEMADDSVLDVSVRRKAFLLEKIKSLT
ncbi:MAG: two-component system LytT family response regulator [Limisphaerales bacterium]|jgi:two-component system LytT family response regulator